MRYEDEEKKSRRQRQYTAGGVGSSRSRSSKSSRRSLVGPSQIQTDEALFTRVLDFSIAAREYRWLGNLRVSLPEVRLFGGEVRGDCQNKIGKTSEKKIWIRYTLGLCSCSISCKCLTAPAYVCRLVGECAS